MTPTFWIAWAGVFGLLIGSFLNVCIFRLPRNCMSINKPRSRCIRCLQLIRWFDNIPIVSWVVLGAKCRHCKTKISMRYPVIELFTGIAFAGTAWMVTHLNGPDAWSGKHQAIIFSIQAYLMAALIASTMIDLDFRILPDEINLSGVVLGLVVSIAYPRWHEILGRELPTELISNRYLAGAFAGSLGAIVGGGSIWIVRILGELIFRKEAMGFGDVKYMAFLGAFLGWEAVLLTFLLACLVGSVYGMIKIIATRSAGAVPFGPFLSAGAVGMLYFSPLVYKGVHWYMQLFRR